MEREGPEDSGCATMEEEEEEEEEEEAAEEKPLLSMLLSHEGTADADADADAHILNWLEQQHQQQEINVSNWIRQRDKEGWLPLHRALERPNCSPDLVRCLLRLDPESIRQRTQDNLRYLPIHVACAAQRPDAAERRLLVLRCLVEAWPGSVRQKAGDNMKSLPLALAVRNVAALPIIQFLTEQWEEGVRRPDSSSGRLTIHWAIEVWGRVSCEPDVIDHLAEQFPQSLLEATMDGGHLPLHLVTRWQLPLRNNVRMVELARIQQIMVGMVRNFVERSPLSVRVAARDGSLPIHCALESGFPAQGVVYLIQQWPESVGITAADGSSLLHLALCRQLPSLALVRLLVEQRPAVLLEVNRRGMLPLHVAAESCDSTEVVRFLVEQSPASVGRADANGSMPIHLAVRRTDNASSLEVVKVLLESLPESAMHADGSGSLPLHIAAAAAACDASSSASVGIVQLLVELQPNAVRHKDKKGLLPLHVAAMNADSPLDVLFVLARQFPEPIYRGRAVATATANANAPIVRPPPPAKRTKLVGSSQLDAE